jgi:uncharacterized ParB-like nuclease family protein
MIELGEQVQDLWRAWQRRARKHKALPLRDFESDARQQRELFGPLNRRAIGIRMVDVSRIVGSVGRSAEFDANFEPTGLNPALDSRFRRVLRAMRAGDALPPIELYKLRRWYYVLDGHHRVGAARRLGVETLEAEVTLFVPSGDPEAVRLFGERLAFERATNLRSIGGVRPATYRRLLTEVHAYRRQLEDERGEAVELQTAALLWYARVFLPAFAALRGSGIQQYFPTLRHADMLALLWAEQRDVRDRMRALVMEEDEGENVGT